MDWVKVVSDQGDQAKTMLREIPPILSSGTATKDQIEGLWNLLDRQCSTIEEIVENLQDADADEHLVNAAEALENIFLDLHAALGEKLIKLGGLRAVRRA